MVVMVSMQESDDDGEDIFECATSPIWAPPPPKWGRSKGLRSAADPKNKSKEALRTAAGSESTKNCGQMSNFGKNSKAKIGQKAKGKILKTST